MDLLLGLNPIEILHELYEHGVFDELFVVLLIGLVGASDEYQEVHQVCVERAVWMNERVSEALPSFIDNFNLKQELEALFSGKDLPETEQVVVAE